MKRVFIIAEAGVNHNGSLETALRLVDVAQEAGADAVKFQSFKADRLVTRDAPKADYQSRNMQDQKTPQYRMLQRLELSNADFVSLKTHCDQKKILFMVTPFDDESVDFIEPLVDRYKVSSGDCTNFPLLRKIASKKKPVILSTGMTSLEEVRRAVEALRGCSVTLLHCTTNYPCPMAEANLRAIQTLREEFGVPVGYSDHTEGIEVAIAAVAMGATVIEKHFTLDRKMQGPDHQASSEPQEFSEMVRQIRNIEKALGDGIKRPQPSEVEVAKVARRSLVFSEDLHEGTILEEKHILLKRPGTGLPPEYFSRVTGKKLKRNVYKDEPLTFDILEGL